MEKFCTVDSSSKFYEQVISFLEEKEQFNKKLRIFISENDLKENEVATTHSSIFVKDTVENREKFGSQLKKKIEYKGFLEFKKNSEIGKGWKIEKPSKPLFIFDYLDVMGRFSETKFIFEDKCYLRLKMEKNFDLPDFVEELKPSEFFKLYETINENKNIILV